MQTLSGIWFRWRLRRRWQRIATDDLRRRQQTQAEINRITIGAIEAMAHTLADGRSVVKHRAADVVEGEAIEDDC